MAKVIKLPEIPEDYLYEDYIAAYFQASGLFIERSMVHKGDIDDILELDIVSSDIQTEAVHKTLVEIKSKGWGYSDIFKVKGWMSFLGIADGIFIVQKQERDMPGCIAIAKELSIQVIDNSDLSNTKDTLAPLVPQQPNEQVIEWIRFAYVLERSMIKAIKRAKRDHTEITSYRKIDNFFSAVNSRSFFKSDPLTRIQRLFSSFTTYKNISAKMANEIETGVFDENCNSLPRAAYSRTFYKGEKNNIHFALYVEHLARIIIFKSCVDYLIFKKSQDNTISFLTSIREMSLPKNITSGLSQIAQEPYFNKYPIFWQIFTYVLGGVIMLDYRDEDYKTLSELSGIPLDNIDLAFDSFNKLFPLEGGWFYNFPSSNFLWHKLFPIPFCGVGVNYRLSAYTENKKIEDMDRITGKNTRDDMHKWNVLAFDILSDILPVIEE